MRRLRWHDRLGCRRGWIRIAGLAAFALVAYLVLYGCLRWTNAITIEFATGWRDLTPSYWVNNPTKYVRLDDLEREGWPW